MIPGQLALPEPAWHARGVMENVSTLAAFRESIFNLSDEQLLALRSGQRIWFTQFIYGNFVSGAGVHLYSSHDLYCLTEAGREVEALIEREIVFRWTSSLEEKLQKRQFARDFKARRRAV